VGGTGGWIAVVTAVTQVIAALAGKVYLGSDARLLRKIERDAALAEKLPPDARQVMDILLQFEVGQHASRRMRQASRQISWASIAAIVIVAAVTVLVCWGLAYLAVTFGWGWWIPFGGVALFGLLLSLSGAGQLFKYPDDDAPASDDPEAASGSAPA
jgi:hypothetical protein